MPREPLLRRALLSDVPALEALIEASVRGLQAQDYTPLQIEGALGSVFGVDRTLIGDRTYFCVEEDGELLACGGWSARRTLFGADAQDGRDDNLLDPEQEAARVRAFFVHPSAARRGLGSRLLSACEAAARAAGFRRTELGATLTGARLYAVRGYVPLEKVATPLPNGERLEIIRMGKIL